MRERSAKKTTEEKAPVNATPGEDKSASGEPREIAPETLLRAQETIRVALKPIQRKQIKVRIRGDILVTHAWSAKAIKQMLLNQQMTEEQKKLAKKKREAKNPEEEFQGARYIRNGKDCFPAVGIKKSLVEAGYALGISRMAIRRGVRIVGDYVEIKTSAPPTMREDPVKVGPFNKREADLRYRPQYDDWSMELTLVFRSDMFTEEQIVTLLQHAGWGGIGEWRADRDGQFGSFEVESA